MESQNKPEPNIITLDDENSIKILHQYVELAQQKGAFILVEADVLKRAIDVLLNNIQDNEIDHTNAKRLLIQAVQKGQRHGAYTLNDASLLNKVVQFVNSSLEGQQQPTQQQKQQQAPQQQPTQPDDLSDLAEPIPLKPKEV